MKRINIVGIGPGSKDYILPGAIDILGKSDVIIGGERNLKSLDLRGKEHVIIKDNLKDIIDFIKQNKSRKIISIVASGDPGFFGILNYIKNYFSISELNIIPGISSVQYLFARIGYSWEDAALGSLHGRGADLIDIAGKSKKAAFLTDNEHTYQYIARLLTEGGLGERKMFVGANLSYDNEIIIENKAKYLLNGKEEFQLCAVVILDE